MALFTQRRERLKVLSWISSRVYSSNMPRIDLDRILSPHPYAKKILRVLNKGGFRSVVVGGAVRDALREKFDRCYTFEPAETDIDIASSASPEQVREKFPDFDFVEVGESFGV